MSDLVEAVPGDPSTEPVATAEQSHVDGRVGPPTIAQDKDAELFVPEGVEQVEPGQVLPADYPWRGGLVEDTEVQADAVPGNRVPQSQASGPVKSEHNTATKSKG
jgi:hypothetical protein